MQYKEIKIGKLKTSSIELRDITKSWLAIALIFTFLHLGISIISGSSLAKVLTHFFWQYFIISLFTVGIGFLLHEMAHKIVAQHYGCAAEFRADNQMLGFALAIAILMGFTFIAPGAVMISGMITRRENGIISLAGPLTNYTLALLFLAGSFFFPAFALVWKVGFMVNSWLGLFNLLPFFVFDGKKIFDWNVLIWLVMVAVGIIFVFVL
jgi:Zn-dependent protease